MKVNKQSDQKPRCTSSKRIFHFYSQANGKLFTSDGKENFSFKIYTMLIYLIFPFSGLNRICIGPLFILWIRAIVGALHLHGVELDGEWPAVRLSVFEWDSATHQFPFIQNHCHLQIMNGKIGKQKSIVDNRFLTICWIAVNLIRLSMVRTFESLLQIYIRNSIRFSCPEHRIQHLKTNNERWAEAHQ